jgi:hypothetical protein
LVEEELQVSAQPTATQFVLAAHATHRPFDNVYPELHSEQTD